MTMRPLLLSLIMAVSLPAAVTRFASGENRTHLLELYSSEGCSSCPPAEAWVASLRAAPGLWRDFVPIAFHVAYWDRLGWRDRFATPEFTARQYAYASAWGADGVYTPGFVLDGAEWRGQGSAPRKSTEIVGVLAVEFADGICRVRFAGGGTAHAAILGGGLVSSVRAGENAGRTLSHEFVALVLAAAPLSGGTAEIKLPLPETRGETRRALAVWITRPGGPGPVQAAGGWLD